MFNEVRDAWKFFLDRFLWLVFCQGIFQGFNIDSLDWLVMFDGLDLYHRSDCE